LRFWILAHRKQSRRPIASHFHCETPAIAGGLKVQRRLVVALLLERYVAEQFMGCGSCFCIVQGGFSLLLGSLQVAAQ
jgi:hypothetical protein